VTPRFRKKFADAGQYIRAGLVRFKEDVQTKQFPAQEHYPYKISAKQLELYYQEMEKIDVSRNGNDVSRNGKPFFNGKEMEKFDGLNRLEAYG